MRCRKIKENEKVDERQINKNSARKAGRQRLIQFTRWDSSDIGIATDFERQNAGSLNINRFRVPTQKLEKIYLLGRLMTSEIKSCISKGIELTTYSVIESRILNLKESRQTINNQ